MNRFLTFLTLFMLLTVVSAASDTDEKTSIKEKYILVIDMQEIGTKESLAPDVSQNLIDEVNRVIELADPEKVVYVEAIMAKLQISLKGLEVAVLPGMFLDDRLKLVNDVRVVKTNADTFSSEQLKHFIENTGANDFIIVGLMAEHCVKASALGGIGLGYQIAVIPEAIAAESEESKNEVLNILVENGVEILTLSEIE